MTWAKLIWNFRVFISLVDAPFHHWKMFVTPDTQLCGFSNHQPNYSIWGGWGFSPPKQDGLPLSVTYNTLSGPTPYSPGIVLLNSILLLRFLSSAFLRNQFLESRYQLNEWRNLQQTEMSKTCEEIKNKYSKSDLFIWWSIFQKLSK